MIKIGIVGSRRRNSNRDLYRTHQVFSLYVQKYGTDNITIISGGCPKGGDKFAEILAEKNNIPIVIHKADWKKHGKVAGFIRNTYIAQDSDVLIAVVSEDRLGGTEDTIKKFHKFHPEGKLILI